ncbi:MAG: hypothetical protein FWE09_00315 [Treponema sp.]|nr:hypothetical protein [Treponema sp.]
MVFYDTVKALVKQNTHLTLQAFVQSLGLNYGTYHGQRKSGNLPRADEALLIAQALGTTVEHLVTGAPPDASSSDKALDDMQAVIDRHRNR